MDDQLDGAPSVDFFELLCIIVAGVEDSCVMVRCRKRWETIPEMP
jgi:hypothetical protein